jgi:uncharacterized protein
MIKAFYNRAVFMGMIILLNFQLISAAQTDELKVLSGIWLGTLKVPGVELRIAITFSENPDGKSSAAFRSIDQSPEDLPFDVINYSNGKVFLKMSAIGIEIEGKVDLAAQTIDSEFRQGGGKFPVLFNRVDQMPGFNRPQEPKKPYPYNEEQVEYQNKPAGIKLAGTLTWPASGGRFPAVILITGSGQQNRDEEIFGHKPFLVLADYLTRHGIAVLRSDDRGIGGSTGDFAQSTTGDFAGDALAGVEFLKNRPEINKRHIGLLGHSEGGVIAPLAATQSPDVSFIVMIAGPGLGMDDIIIYQRSQRYKLMGMKDEDIALQRSWYKSIYGVSKENIDNSAAADKIRSLFNALSEDQKQRLNWNNERLEKEIPGLLHPWWRFIMAYDPRATLMQVKCPVLAIIGEKDTQVPAKENILAIEEALQAGGHKDCLVKELPGLNHMLQTAETGSEFEYTKIEETMSPDALKLIADWIMEHVK